MNTLSRCRDWCFTINNYDGLVPFDSDIMRYMIQQEEIGEDGFTNHLQGYVEFKKSTRFNTAKSFIGDYSHIEPRRGTRDQARDYCRKPESRVGGPYEDGTWVRNGQRTDIEGFVKSIKDGKSDQQLLNDHLNEYMRFNRSVDRVRFALNEVKAQQWRNVMCTLLVGDTGTGKTRYVYDHFQPENIYRITQDYKGWFTGYVSQKVLLIDDFAGWIGYRELLTLCEGHPKMLQTKGAHTWALWDTVFFTSNLDINTWYPHPIPELLRRVPVIVNFP
nr:MAG: replication associated protein [Arizlama virus]